jgi:septal ring factor EnvC (AmiA/AmiB activator)
MVKGYIIKKKNNGKIMESHRKNFRDILLFVLGCLITYLLIQSFRPISDNSKLLNYKLKQLDSKILETEKKQKQLDDSINVFKKNILQIDKNIENIKNQKTIIYNYYQQMEKEIYSFTNKQIDSTLRQRYKF